jgi:hypothetical protein
MANTHRQPRTLNKDVNPARVVALGRGTTVGVAVFSVIATAYEASCLRSQIATLRCGRGQYRKFDPTSPSLL